MNPSLLSANVFICERILEGKDGILSAIRMVDTFKFKRNIDKPNDQIEMQVLASIRTTPGDDSEHSIQLYLVNPDGTKELVAGQSGDSQERQDNEVLGDSHDFRYRR